MISWTVHLQNICGESSVDVDGAFASQALKVMNSFYVISELFRNQHYRGSIHPVRE